MKEGQSIEDGLLEKKAQEMLSAGLSIGVYVRR